MSKHTFDDLPEYLVPIEHSALGSSWAKKAHKYIAKIGNKYYYDARELAAATGKKVSNFVTGKAAASELASAKRASNVASSDARLARTSAAKKYGAMVANRTSKSAVNNARMKSTQQRLAKAQKAYDRTLPGIVKRVKNSSVGSVLNKLGVSANHNKVYGTVKSSINKARNTVSNASKKLKNSVKDGTLKKNLLGGTYYKFGNTTVNPLTYNAGNGKKINYKKVSANKTVKKRVGR